MFFANSPIRQFAGLFLVLLAFSCSSSDTSDFAEMDDRSIEQSLISSPPYNDLGYGFYEMEGQKLCIPQFEENIYPGVVSRISTALISESSEIEATLKEASGWNIQLLGEFEFLKQEFTQRQLRNEEFQVLMIFATIATAARILDTDREVDYEDWDAPYLRESLCNEGQHPSSRGEFLELCGAEVVTKELKGGYAILMADLSVLTTEERYSLKESLDTNLSLDPEMIAAIIAGDVDTIPSTGSGYNNFGFGYSLSEAIERINNSSSSSLNWISYQYGLNGFAFGGLPDSNGSGDWSNEQASDWQDYLARIQNDVNEALLDQDTGWEDPRFGMHLAYVTTPYHELDLSTCDYSFSFEGIACAADLYQAFHTVTAPYGIFQAQKAAIDFRLAHPDRVEWPANDPQGSKDRLERIRDTLTECEGQLRLAYSGNGQCREALNGSVSDGEVCELCTYPAGCSPEELITELTDIPVLLHPGMDPYQPLSFSVTQTSFGAEPRLASSNSMVCFLAGVQGKFAGGGEFVGLGQRYFPDYGMSWTGRVDSLRSEPSELITGRFNCVERLHFQDNGGGGLEDNGVNSGLSLAAEDGVRDTIEVTENRFFALAGIRGALRDDDDFAEARNFIEHAELVVSADSDFVRAHFLPMYFVHPHNDRVAYHSIHNESVMALEFRIQNRDEDGLIRNRQRRLIPVRDGVCFLTRVGGLFDGRGERIRIEAEDNYWYIRGAAAADKDLNAWATCVLYDQMSIQ